MVPTLDQQTAALSVQPSHGENRLSQARRYDLRDETTLLLAALGVLQDLGYTIDESSRSVGLINGSKRRLNTAIRVSLVVKPANDRQATIARVTFQAITGAANGSQLQAETIIDPAIYNRFFEALSQSLYLEAQQL